MKVIQLMKVPMEMLMMRMMKKLNLQSKNKQSYLIILKSNWKAQKYAFTTCIVLWFNLPLL